MKAQPGDIIIVTDKDCVNLLGKECVVMDAHGVPFHGADMSKVILAKGHDGRRISGSCWLYNDDYQIIEDPKTVKVKVGDSVIIMNENWNSHFYLKTFIVREVGATNVTVTRKPTGGSEGYAVDFDAYRVLKRRSNVSLEICPDCKGTGKVELFTSTVKCDCCK